MSSTTQFTTFVDLYEGLLKAIRSDRAASATVEQAKRYINTALSDLHVGFAEKVPWALRDFSFSTTTTFTTTVSAVGSNVTNTPNSIVTTTYDFANADLNAFIIGQKLAVTSTVVDANTGIEGEVRTATSANPGVVSTTALGLVVDDAIRIYQDEIIMPNDFMRLAGNTVKLGVRDIPVMGRVEFRHRFAGDFTVNRPQFITMIDTTDAISGLDNRKLRLFPIPNTVERGHLTYVTNLLVVATNGTWQQEFSADTDVPIIPLRYRHVLFYHALYNWYRDRKDDVRSQEAKAEYIEILNRVTNDTEGGQSNMSISLKNKSYRRKSQRPFSRGRGGSRRYDFGRFDRME